MKKQYNETVRGKRSYMKMAVLLFVLTLGFSTGLKAQLAMTRSSFTGAFTPITSGGGATVSSAVGDDSYATGHPIGFTFNYLGTGYTTFNVSTNGWMNFAAVSTSNAGNVDLYSTSAPLAALAPWWDDLSSSEIAYQTTGTAGSQVCVIQWTSLSYYTTSTRNIRFQVKLYEGTNVIEFAYDALPTGTLYTSESASIGIKGATGGAGQFIDAVTGSSFVGNGSLQSDRYPSYNFRFTPGAPAALAAGTYNVGVGQTYTNLNEAVADINHRGVAGAVVLNLTDAQYDITVANGGNFFPILFGPITGASAANTVTVTKTGTAAIVAYGGASGTNGFITNQASTSALSSNTDPIIGLVGADYVTLNNLDIRGNVLNQSSDHAVGVYNNTATDGATNNVIQNITVTMSRANTGSRGFLSNVLTTPTSAAGANSNNAYKDFVIKNVFAGIQLSGNASFPDLNTVIGTSVCTNFNTIGNPAQANDIGNGSSQTYGILASNQSGINIYNNSIRNVTASAAQVDGIVLTTFQGTSSVYNNKIQTIKNSGTSSTTAIAGIRASHTTTGTHSLRIYNNAISEIISSHTGTATTTRTLKGIYVNSAGNNSATVNYQVHNNTVSIDGSSTLNLSSVCFEVGSTGGPVYNVSNNIFANLTATQGATARHMAIFTPTAGTFGPAGSTSNNNDLYIANDLGTSGFTGFTTTSTGFATVANWTAGVTPAGLETASVAANPVFTSAPADLHSASAAANAAGQAYQAYVTTDLDCAARTDNDMGAYIINACTGTPTAGSITGINGVCSGLGTTLTLTGATSAVGISYQWASSTTSGGPYTNMGTVATQATGALTATTYYVVTVSCSASGLSSTTAEKTVTVNPNPALTTNPTAALYCAPNAGTALSVSSTGGTGTVNFTWAPSTGLSATTGASVNASPSANTTYTVTGTDANGCTGTATAAITSGTVPFISSITATPPSVCSGANSQLQVTDVGTSSTVNTYSFSATSGTYTPITGTTLGAGSIGDDVGIGNIPIGFNFNYHGTYFSVFGARSNGLIELGQTAASLSGFSANSLSGNANCIAPFWDDNNTTGGSIIYATTGTAPNRVLTVQWTGMHVGGGGSSSSTTIDMQILLYEATGNIQFIYGSTSGTISSTASIGLSGASGNYLSVTPLLPVTTSTASSSSENTSISSAANVPSGTIYNFAYTPVATTNSYAWAPPTFLSSTTIANPLATGVTASNVYTVTVSQASGCLSTATVSITAGAALISAASISPSNTVCVNSNITLNATPTGGGAPYTYAWTGPNSFTSTSQNPAITGVTMAAAGTYTVVITDNCGANSTAMVTLTLNTLPTVVSTPSSGLICLPGGSAVSLLASGANTYSWTPSAGLSSTNTAATNANPTANTTYTVTGTDANGCSSTATATISVGANPSTPVVTATPPSVCSGANSQLNATSVMNTYAVSSIPFAAVATPGTGVTTLCNAGTAVVPVSGIGSGTLDDDGWGNQTLPFSFSFFGTTYTSFALSTNGFMYLGTGNPTTYGGYNNVWPSTAPATPVIGAMYADLDFRSAGTINYFTTGTAPNRTLVVNWSGGQFWNGTGNLTTQIIIYETTNVVEVHTTSSSGTNVGVEGIMNAAGTVAYTAPGRNNVNVSVATPDAYRFTPDAPTFSWSPATFLNSTTISNPLASGITASTNYTVTATSPIGCAVTGTVAITAGAALTSAATIAPSNTVCVGTNITLHAAPTGGGAPYTYVWTGPNGFSATVQDSVLNNITAAQAGTYTVVISDNCGSNSTAMVTLTVNGLPTVVSTPSSGLICLPGGSAVSLLASGANTYSWTPSAGLSATNTAATNANPTGTTTYTVTGTDANGCSSTATATINVGNVPVISAISATPSTVCTGGNSQLAATGGFNGTYCTAGYTTGTGSNDYITNVTLGTINNTTGASSAPYNTYYSALSTNLAANTSYTVTGTINNGGTEGIAVWIDYNQDGTFSATEKLGEMQGLSYSIPFTVPATAFNGTTRMRVRNVYNGSGILPCNSVTYGEVEDYNVLISGGLNAVTFAWTPAASLNDPTLANPTASNITSSTSYSLTVTSGIGCVSAVSTVSVTVSPLSSVSVAAVPSTPICAGASVVMTATPVGGGPYTYAWTPGGATTATDTVTPSVTTTYSLTVTNTCGESVSTTATVNVNALPVVSATATSALYCTPGSPAIPITATGAATYTWSPSAGLDVTNTATPNATPAISTTYTVTGTDANGCQDTATVMITAAPAVTSPVASATPSTVCANDTVALTASASTAYTVFTENFNSATNGWTTTNNTVGAGANFAATAWTLQPDGAVISFATHNSNDNTQFYSSNADAGGSGSVTNTTLTSPRIDVSGAATLSLSFYHYFHYGFGSPDQGTVQVSTDGVNYTALQTYTATSGSATGFAQQTFNLNPYAGSDTLYIQFAYKSGWGYEWAIDNLTLNGTLSTLNYAWTSTPAGFTAATQNATANPTVSTNYSVTISNSMGCSNTASASVTVNPLPVVSLGNDTAVCSAGMPLTLDAGNAGSTYMWSTTATTQTIAASTAGSYDVSVTDANGCVGMDTILITINPSPVVALGTDTTRCGGTVTLDAQNAGSTYLWSDASTGSTITVSSSGQYDVTVTSPQGCVGQDTINVTINTIPTVSLGNDTLFCGTTLTLDAQNSGSGFFWNTTETTQTINVSTTGLYFVTVTTPQSCSATDSINVTIAAPISVNLGNDSLVCQNTSLFLDAQNTGSTYLWNDGTTTSTLLVTNPGTYYVLVTSPAGCTATDTVVYGDNSPVVTLSLPFTTTCVNTTTNALSGGAPTGGFYSGTGVTGTNFNATTAGVGSILITYTYTDGTTGCAAADTQTVVVDPCTGIKAQSIAASIQVAPNPTTGNFSILMPTRDNTVKAEMYTVEGQLIYSSTLKGREVYEVNITNLANAIYYLRLTVDGETTVVKVVKQE